MRDRQSGSRRIEVDVGEAVALRGGEGSIQVGASAVMARPEVDGRAGGAGPAAKRPRPAFLSSSARRRQAQGLRPGVP